jgi:hypothetical protein
LQVKIYIPLVTYFIFAFGGGLGRALVGYLVIASGDVVKEYKKITGKLDAAEAEAERVANEAAAAERVVALKEEEKKIRKPYTADDECPICFETFANEAVVWCRAACGNNFHRVSICYCYPCALITHWNICPLYSTPYDMVWYGIWWWNVIDVY